MPRSIAVSILTSLLSTGLALTSLACTPTPPSNPSASPDSPSQLPSEPFDPSQPVTPPSSDGILPDTVRDRVLMTASTDTNQPVEALDIGTYRAETWSDGCLGLGGAAELCLAALTDGWEVEVLTPSQTLVYRTDATGMSIRRDWNASDSRDRLSSDTRDRLLAAAATQIALPVERLSVAHVEAQTWNGCFGMTPSVQTACPEIAIAGWRVVVSDGEQNWLFHLDQTAEQVRLNDYASPTVATIEFMPRQRGLNVGDDAIFQMDANNDLSGEMRQYRLEKDGRVILLQSSPLARYAPQTLKQLSPAELQAFVDLLDAQGFHNFAGLAYRPSPAVGDMQWIKLQSDSGQMQYVEFTAPTLPLGLAEIMTAWEQLITVDPAAVGESASDDGLSTGFPRLE